MKTILVVDDSKTIRTSLRAILSNEGYKVLLASDGKEGLDIVRNHMDIDLVISDLNMPKLNGIQMISEIRKEGLLQDIPILMITTEAESSIVQQAKELEVRGWIWKPFKLKEITENITSAWK